MEMGKNVRKIRRGEKEMRKKGDELPLNERIDESGERDGLTEVLRAEKLRF